MYRIRKFKINFRNKMTLKYPDLLKMEILNLYNTRNKHSNLKIDELKKKLSSSPEVQSFDKISIFCAGSYARLEASEYSDIDLFFISSKPTKEYEDNYRVPKIKLMSSVIQIGDELGFPKFSNDGQFLHIIHVNDILENLGGSLDDYKNNFTARLLMLLESKPLHGDIIFKEINNSIINSYFRDYPGHESTFRPNFLLNDIVRFWKTLCLNYENKRNSTSEDDSVIIKQKIKNFKLKYSRMLTCYASIAYLTSIPAGIQVEDVSKMTDYSPMQRLLLVQDYIKDATPHIKEVVDSYHWFLERTNVPENDLIEYFSDKDRKTDAFKKSQQFGDQIFNILKRIDEKNDVFRYLVI